MSEDNKLVTEIASNTVAPPREMLEEQDRHTLDMAKMKLNLVVVQAEKALAQNDAGKMAYSNLLLQLAMKYSLTNQDAISEEGEILRGQAGNVNK